MALERSDYDPVARVLTVQKGKGGKGREVPLQAGLKEMERLLNQDIDYGGGENPFKGIRWPIQPK